MKKFATAFILLLILLSSNPAVVQANDISGERDRYLLALIAELRVELLRLQVLLLEKLNEPATFFPYKAELFRQPVETKYLVRDGNLYPETGKSVREIDQQLFRHAKDTLGETVVTNYLKEWRIFYSPGGNIDAYVEQISGSDKYVMNLNRAGFNVTSSLDRSVLAELFVHEYAHMIFINNPKVIGDYKNKFWTASEEKIAAGSAVQRENYFNVNQDRFVSEYSLQSVDEDMAEIFLYAVINPSELSFGARQDKYDFLSDIPYVKAEIVRLREQLN